MPPETTTSLLINTVLILLHVLALALVMWRQPPVPDRPALVLWLVGSLLWLVAVTARQVGVAYAAPRVAFVLLNNVAYSAFGLSAMATFALVVATAGAMREALHVLARTGFVAWFVLQLPLWRGDFFPQVRPTTLGTQADLTTVQALFGAFVLLGWQFLTLFVAYHYRARFTRRLLVVGLLAFQGIGLLAVLSADFRAAGVITWAAALPMLLVLYDGLRSAAGNTGAGRG